MSQYTERIEGRCTKEQKEWLRRQAALATIEEAEDVSIAEIIRRLIEEKRKK